MCGFGGATSSTSLGKTNTNAPQGSERNTASALAMIVSGWQSHVDFAAQRLRLYVW
jgi:hypothetical protein